MLVVKMFGSLELTRLDEGSKRFPICLSGRPRSLFAYLALHPGRVFARSELASILWLDCNNCGSGALSTTLWRLRRLIETPRGESIVISTSTEGIRLPLGAQIESDANRFAQLIEPCFARQSAERSEEELERLRAAVALYGADLLSNLTDEWVQVPRDRYRRMYLFSLGCLVAWHEAQREYDVAIRYAERFLECDGLREDVHRRLMRLFVLNGQQPLALRQYENCRALLKRELAIQPMPQTQELYQCIARAAVRSLGQGRVLNSIDSCDGDVIGV